MDQQTFQKTVNELVNAKPEELDEREREFLKDNRGYNQQIQALDSRVQQMEKQIADMKVERNKLEGAAEYAINKAVQHRVERSKPKEAAKSGTEDKPVAPKIKSKSERKAAGEEAPAGGAEGQPEAVAAPN